MHTYVVKSVVQNITGFWLTDYIDTECTQKNGAVSIVFTIGTAPFFCVYSV
jgi:hypothetical protein